MDTLPIELVREICRAVPALLLCSKRYVAIGTEEMKAEYLISIGYSIWISRCETSWRKNGVLHRLDGPALESQDWDWADTSYDERIRSHVPNDGSELFNKGWFRNGSRHRVEGPAVVNVDGSVEYYENGVLHNLNGPAIMGPHTNFHMRGYDHFYGRRTMMSAREGLDEIWMIEGLVIGVWLFGTDYMYMWDRMSIE